MQTTTTITQGPDRQPDGLWRVRSGVQGVAPDRRDGGGADAGPASDRRRRDSDGRGRYPEVADGNGVGQRIIAAPDDTLEAVCATAHRIFWGWSIGLFAIQTACRCRVLADGRQRDAVPADPAAGGRVSFHAGGTGAGRAGDACGQAAPHRVDRRGAGRRRKPDVGAAGPALALGAGADPAAPVVRADLADRRAPPASVDPDSRPRASPRCAPSSATAGRCWVWSWSRRCGCRRTS